MRYRAALRPDEAFLFDAEWLKRYLVCLGNPLIRHLARHQIDTLSKAGIDANGLLNTGESQADYKG